MRFRIRLASPYDLDECQRRVWLLNGITVAIQDQGAVTCLARAEADEAGFAVWTIGRHYAGGIGESAFAVRGRWWSDGAGTRVEAGYRPRPKFAVLVLTVLGGLGLYLCAFALGPDDYLDTLAALAAPVVGGGLFALAILAFVGFQDLRSLKLDRLVEATLCDRVGPDSGEGGRGSWRRARRRRERVGSSQHE